MTDGDMRERVVHRIAIKEAFEGSYYINAHVYTLVFTAHQALTLAIILASYIARAFIGELSILYKLLHKEL